MPLYEFVCVACDARSDVRASIAEISALTPACAACGSKETRRALPRIAVRSRGVPARAVAADSTPSGCGGGCACSCGA